MYVVKHTNDVNFILDITGDYCISPKYWVLSSIRRKFGTKWEGVGAQLDLESEVLDSIGINVSKVEEQAFTMLAKWMEKDDKSCYCKLINAMNEEHLGDAVKALKEKIKSPPPLTHIDHNSKFLVFPTTVYRVACWMIHMYVHIYNAMDIKLKFQ